MSTSQGHKGCWKLLEATRGMQQILPEPPGPTLPTPGFQTSSPQNQVVILSHHVCGNSLQQPQETNTPVKNFLIFTGIL